MSTMEVQPGLMLQIRETPRGILLRLSGQADLSTVENLRVEVSRILAQQPQVVILDFTDLTFLSSLALGTLVELERGVSRRRGIVRIAGAQGYIRDVLRYTRLDSAFKVYDTLDDALVA